MAQTLQVLAVTSACAVLLGPARGFDALTLTAGAWVVKARCSGVNEVPTA